MNMMTLIAIRTINALLACARDIRRLYCCSWYAIDSVPCVKLNQEIHPSTS